MWRLRLLTRLACVVLLLAAGGWSCEGRRRPHRSPLELGLVQFTVSAVPGSLAGAHHAVTVLVPSVLQHGGNGTQQLVRTPHTLTPVAAVHDPTLRWVPGHVHGHAFVPGHVAHVVVPEHAVLVTHAVLIHAPPHGHAVSPYRKHYGGFGVGLHHGGHGAGHGYHVL